MFISFKVRSSKVINFDKVLKFKDEEQKSVMNSNYVNYEYMIKNII